ncbi:MAG: Do family serine endopeptidase [Halocynthiibacter sp.]
MTSQSIAVARRQTANTYGSPRMVAMFLGLLSVMALMFATSARAAAPNSFADLAEKVQPAVVNITTVTTVKPQRRGIEPIVPEGSPFEDLFRDFFDQQNRGPSRPHKSQALGSGFVISEDGYLITNNHVIDGADKIMIEFFSGDELEAKLIGTDPKTDIALLKVETEDALPFVMLGDSDVARVGDWVMAVGNPLGQGFSVSAGIVSARNRALSGTYDDYIQTDAAINRGNSGGPLFNLDGDVIGVNTAILSPDGGSIGIGFAMASNVVEKVVNQLKEFGETRRGWLGVRIQDVTADMAEALGLEEDAGALVTSVPDGPAKDAGMKAGDLIQSFDGQVVKDTRGLVKSVGNAEVGKAVRVVVFRDGKFVTLKVTLGRRETAENPQSQPVKAPVDPVEETTLGLTLSEIGAADIEAMGEDARGLIVRDVDVSAAAYDKGLRAGDVITDVAQAPVNTVEEFTAEIETAKSNGRKAVLILVKRGDNSRFVALPVE